VALARTVIARDSARRETTVTIGNASANYEYDGAGHLARQWGRGLSASMPVTPTYAYDLASGSDGRKHADHLPFALGGSVDASYTYTPDGRLASVDDVTSAKDASYTYDLAGNITGVSGGVAKTLTYDPLTSRLTSYSVGGATTNVTFDANTGWRTTCGSSTLTYTGTGRLKTYDTPAISGIDGAYSYDGNGQRTRSVVRNSAGTTTTTDWTYEGLKLHQLSSTRTDGAWWKIVYLYDVTDRPYAGVYTGSDAAVPITFTMVTTDRGDIAELLGSDGAAFGSYRYDPWGNASVPTSQAVLGISLAQASAITSRQALRYAGYVYDPESSMYYCSARHYDPLTMQFISKDPARADGEESAYQYCGGDPVNNSDPSGLEKIDLNLDMAIYPQYGDDCFVAALGTLNIWLKHRVIDWADNYHYWYQSRWGMAEDWFARYEGGDRAAFKFWGRDAWKKAFLKRYGISMADAEAHPLSWTDLTTELRMQRPILAAGRTPKGRIGHAWVISGFWRRKGKQQVRVTTWSGRQWVDYQDLIGRGGFFAFPDASGGYRFQWQYSAWGLK